jgi:hypothetical protein
MLEFGNGLSHRIREASLTSIVLPSSSITEAECANMLIIKVAHRNHRALFDHAKCDWYFPERKRGNDHIH